nr:S-layer homology domain-containing protein [Lysinibacillus timonensis]
MMSKSNKKNKINLSKILALTTLTGCIVFSGNEAIASNFSTSSEPVATSNITYNDFNANQYWAEDMLWAIDKGLISGYIDATHPTNKNIKIVGNWLNPYGNLTEAQMVTILFRYAKPDELTKTTPATGWWASAPYQLAEKYGVPTDASLNNQSKSNGVVTRGELARALATVHFGKEVNLQDSVKFMYEAGLSSGKDQSKGKTYENFGVNDQLKRAQIVSFMKRYDDFLKAGGNVTHPEESLSSLIAPSENNKVFGITVQYGSHTYASKNQAEYDKVMSIVQDKIISAYDEIDLAVDEDVNRYYHEYLDGARGIKGDRLDPVVRERRNVSLIQAELIFGSLVDAGISKDAIIGIDKGISIARSLLNGATFPDGPSRPGNAYTLLVDGVRTGYSEATVFSAVFDSLGYKTVILVKEEDGYLYEGVLVEVEGKWVDVSYSFGTKLAIVDLEELYSKGYGVDILHQ